MLVYLDVIILFDTHELFSVAYGSSESLELELEPSPFTGALDGDPLPLPGFLSGPFPFESLEDEDPLEDEDRFRDSRLAMLDCKGANGISLARTD